jgi:anti-sigma B factor antagonist
MKIKTEIIHSIFIITCNGPSRDASLAHEFLNAMGGFIKKSQMDILLDISEVNFVDSTGLGTIIRSLSEIGGKGKLILCGVNERTLTLLKMTHLNKTIKVHPVNEYLKKIISLK